MELIPPVRNEEGVEEEEYLNEQQKKDLTSFTKILSEEQLHRLAKNIESGDLPASPEQEISDLVWAATRDKQEAHELGEQLKKKLGEKRYEHFKPMDLQAALGGNDVNTNRFLNELHNIIAATALKRGIFFKDSSDDSDTIESN
ncbi:MAG: hypothetical protein WDZ70_02355 [Candidatus Paceibacterota bacterium]